MAADTSEDLKSDLAYVRALAEEGAAAPLVGGLGYVVWGAVIGGASLLSYLTEIGVAPLPGRWPLYLWVGAIGLGWALSFVFGPRSGRKPGAHTLGNRTARSAWAACGVFITFFWIALMFAHGRYQDLGVPPYFLMSMTMPVAFGLYGVAFSATSAAARAPWMRAFSLVSWATAAALLFVLDEPEFFLIASLATFAVVFAPGVYLMRREPSEIV